MSGSWTRSRTRTARAAAIRSVRSAARCETEELEKLYVSSTADEHGEAVVGRYLVIVTDTDNKAPVSGAAVELDGEHLFIRLPDRRLLDYADQTTITVLLAEPETP